MFYRFHIIVSLLISMAFLQNALAATAGKSSTKDTAKNRRTVEAQLSGITTNYSDQIYARLSLQEEGESRRWYLRGTYNRTTTDSGSSETRVLTSRADFRHETLGNSGDYHVWSAVLSRRDRDKSRGVERSGYQFTAYGIGKQLDARNKGDIGLGFLHKYDNGGDTKPVVYCSVIGTGYLREKLTTDGRILVLQPIDSLHSTKLDGEIGISYALTDGLAVRLSWSANNLIRPVQGDREWDSVVRLTFSYQHTSKS